MRELVDVSTVKSAEISRPHDRFIGLLNGGTRPIVCVRAVHPNFLGMEATQYYWFYFDNGRTTGTKVDPNAPIRGCPGQDFTPFTELRAR